MILLGSTSVREVADSRLGLELDYADGSWVTCTVAQSCIKLGLSVLEVFLQSRPIPVSMSQQVLPSQAKAMLLVSASLVNETNPPSGQ